MNLDKLNRIREELNTLMFNSHKFTFNDMCLLNNLLLNVVNVVEMRKKCLILFNNSIKLDILVINPY